MTIKVTKEVKDVTDEKRQALLNELHDKLTTKRNVKNFTLRLPVELHEQLRSEAERMGVGVKSLIVFALWNAARAQTSVQA